MVFKIFTQRDGGIHGHTKLTVEFCSHPSYSRLKKQTNQRRRSRTQFIHFFAIIGLTIGVPRTFLLGFHPTDLGTSLHLQQSFPMFFGVLDMLVLHKFHYALGVLEDLSARTFSNKTQKSFGLQPMSNIEVAIRHFKR